MRGLDEGIGIGIVGGDRPGGGVGVVNIGQADLPVRLEPLGCPTANGTFYI